MDTIYAAVIGILIAILIFGLKTGVGCGFSSVKRRDVLILATGYFIISLILGSLVGLVDESYLEVIASLGMTLHVLIALILIVAGIYTQKKWICGHDVSKRTFLVISVPCPVCLTALFVSCMILASTLEVDGWKVGVLVGIVFFLSVVLSTWVFRSMKKTPEDLGTAMMFLGIFYLMGAMIVPAYIKAKKLNISPIEGGGLDVITLLVISLFILGGFALNQMRGQ
jgi:predicted transporter